MSLLKVQMGVGGVVLLSVFCGISASFRERSARLKKPVCDLPITTSLKRRRRTWD
jgi:hypothetical protein